MNYIFIIGLITIELTIVGFSFYILHKIREPIEKLQDYTKTFSDIFLRAWESHRKLIESEHKVYEAILKSNDDMNKLVELIGEQYDSFRDIHIHASETYEKMYKVFQTIVVDLKEAEDRYSAGYELFREVSEKLDKIIPVEATLEVAAPGPYYGPEVKDHDEHMEETA